MKSKKVSVSVPLKILRIEGDGIHLLIKIKINNKNALLVVDTGASKTVLDKNRINRFVEHDNFKLNPQLSSGLGTNTMESHSVKLSIMKIGKMQIIDLDMIMIDLSNVNTAYSEYGFKEVDGVFGSDLMMMFDAVIDFKKELLRLTYRRS